MTGAEHHLGEKGKNSGNRALSDLTGTDACNLGGQIAGCVYRFDMGQGDVLDFETLKQWKEPSSRKDALLLRSISEGRYHAVPWLLREGADPNIRNMFGLPVLMTAIARQQAEVVRLLLEAGADTQVQHGGFTPLLYAQMTQDEVIIRMFEKH